VRVALLGRGGRQGVRPGGRRPGLALGEIVEERGDLVLVLGGLRRPRQIPHTVILTAFLPVTIARCPGHRLSWVPPLMGKSTAGRRIFVAHAAEDRGALKQLRAHIAALGKKEVVITSLDDVPPGAEPRDAIDQLLDAADMVVVLLSADLFGS